MVYGVKPASAQPVQYRFQHFTSENGLAQNTVYDICQDKYGFIWFSTKNGVCKYDGYQVKIFKPSDFMQEDVVDLSQCIETDGDGDVVFGTSSGFYFISVETDSIVSRVIYQHPDTADTYQKNVYSLATQGTIIWAGTGNGLLRYDKRSRELRYFEGKELYPQTHHSRFWIKNLSVDSFGRLWMTTPEGLLRMDTKDFHTDIFNASATGKYFIHNNYFSSVTFDHKGRIWAGTLRKGIYRIDPETNKVDSLNFTGLTDSSESFNEIKRILCDSKGYIWAATQYTGLVRIHPTTFEIQRIRQNPLSFNSLASDYISGLFEDRGGILWVGTYNNGVDRTAIAGSRFLNIPFSTSDSSCFGIKAVECFSEQGDSLLWVGTMQGLFAFDKRNHKCRTFEEITNGRIPLPHQSIVGVEPDINNFLWIGTRSDILVRADLSHNSYRYYRLDTSQYIFRGTQDLKALYRAPDGLLYFSFDSRVCTYNPQRDALELLMDRDSLMLELKRIIRISREGRYLFLSTDDSGLYRFDPENKTLRPIESPDYTKDMLTQNVTVRHFVDGRYLISNYKGLYLLDSAMKFTAFYNEKNGLSDNKITNIHIDKGGKVWMATFNGLSSFLPGTKTFINYYTQDGLAENEFREGKSMQGLDGTLYFPTNKGFTFFQPDRIFSTLKEVSVFLTGFKIFGKEKKFGKNLNNLDEISVPAGNNFFSISFSSTAYNTIQPGTFAYKLEGVDPNWVISGTSNTANYTNIDGGDYVFRVRLFPQATAERKLRIHVGTVFYKTFWFRLLAFVILGIIIFLFIRMRERQMVRRESDKTIDYFANSFYGKNSVEEILWDVCRNCISRLGFEDAVVYLVDNDRKLLVQKAAYGPKNPKDFEIVHPIEIPLGHGIVGSVALSGKAEIINDTMRDVRYIADDDTRLSEIAVPIIYEGNVIGVIDSEHSRKGFFQPEHLRILTTIASICSTKLAKAQSDLAAAERERMLLEIGKKVAETRLMALRAQMNPHFIFNALNSIQECIVKEQVEDAHKYLSQFSRLLRKVIDYSEKNVISLDQEVEFLNLYLNLESLRFGGSFKYRIDVDPELDAEETYIPSLLIQPFAENAIWHGLLHKPDNRELTISFRVKDNNHLVCIVEDNGIGRTKAREIRESKLDISRHESKGMRISQERLDLVRLQTNLDPEIRVEDLYDLEGRPSGTRVTVTLPIDLESHQF